MRQGPRRRLPRVFEPHHRARGQLPSFQIPGDRPRVAPDQECLQEGRRGRCRLELQGMVAVLEGEPRIPDDGRRPDARQELQSMQDRCILSAQHRMRSTRLSGAMASDCELAPHALRPDGRLPRFGGLDMRRGPRLHSKPDPPRSRDRMRHVLSKEGNQRNERCPDQTPPDLQ